VRGKADGGKLRKRDRNYSERGESDFFWAEGNLMLPVGEDKREARGSLPPPGGVSFLTKDQVTRQKDRRTT